MDEATNQGVHAVAGPDRPAPRRRGRHATAGDAELVAAVRGGDSAAFSELYRRHAGAVHVAVRDNVRDADTANDVVQETFTRALARLDSLRDADKFRPWVLSIGRHAAVDARRFRNRVDALDDDAAVAITSDRWEPATEAELSDLSTLLTDGIATLSPRDATALSLVTHLGFGPAEVGAALGCNANAAKVTVHRARRRLRDAVALQVLVRAEGAACSTFEAHVGDDDLVAAARHVRDCDACATAAEREVDLFGTRRSA